MTQRGTIRPSARQRKWSTYYHSVVGARKVEINHELTVSPRKEREREREREREIRNTCARMSHKLLEEVVPYLIYTKIISKRSFKPAAAAL